MRTCGGSSTEPTAPDCVNHGAAKQFEAVLSRRANTAAPGKKRKIEKVLDERAGDSGALRRRQYKRKKKAGP